MLTISSLFAILRLLFSRTAAVSPRNILLLLRFGFHLTRILVFPFASTTKGNTILQNALKIIVSTHTLNNQ